MFATKHPALASLPALASATCCPQLFMKVFDQCMVGLAFLHLMMVSWRGGGMPDARPELEQFSARLALD